VRDIDDKPATVCRLKFTRPSKENPSRPLIDHQTTRKRESSISFAMSAQRTFIEGFKDAVISSTQDYPDAHPEINPAPVSQPAHKS